MFIIIYMNHVKLNATTLLTDHGYRSWRLPELTEIDYFMLDVINSLECIMHTASGEARC